MNTPRDARIVGIIKSTYDTGKEKTTYTKLIMTFVMLLYFAGVVLGGVLVIWSAKTDVALGLPIDSQMFIAYAAYVGGPTATAIGFYAWKSKAENLLKIQKSNDCSTEDPGKSQEMIELLANMKGE